MKTEIKKIDGVRRELSVEIGAEAVKQKFDEVFQRIAKEAKVAGFRPGHAPRDIIEKHFFQRAKELVLNELLPEAYQQAIEKEAINALDMPLISDVRLEKDVLSFRAVIEVAPEIKFKNDWRGLKIEYKKIEAAPDEIKRNIDALKEKNKAQSLDDNFARSLGYPDLKSLEGSLEKQIFLQKEGQERQKIEDEILEKITKDMDFQLPQSLVNRDLEELLKEARLDLALKGFAKEKIDAQEKEMRERLEPLAKKRVKVYLALSAIAKDQNIPLDKEMANKVMGILLASANWQENS